MGRCPTAARAGDAPAVPSDVISSEGAAPFASGGDAYGIEGRSGESLNLYRAMGAGCAQPMPSHSSPRLCHPASNRRAVTTGCMHRLLLLGLSRPHECSAQCIAQSASVRHSSTQNSQELATCSSNHAGRCGELRQVDDALSDCMLTCRMGSASLSDIRLPLCCEEPPTEGAGVGGTSGASAPARPSGGNSGSRHAGLDAAPLTGSSAACSSHNKDKLSPRSAGRCKYRAFPRCQARLACPSLQQDHKVMHGGQKHACKLSQPL